MKLKKILVEHHRCKPPGHLSDNLGDGYLIQYNSVFRNIRKAALDAGVRFVSQRFEGYDVLPLVQLPKILESKMVPYAPNVQVLDEIETQFPDHFQLGQLPPLKANYVMHESAHVLARKIRVRHLGDLKIDFSAGPSKTLVSERRLALAILIEEAFANTTESLLSLASTNTVHDQFVLKNAYVHETPEMRKFLRNAVSRFGIVPVFKLVLLSFVHANFLKTKLNPKELDRVLRFAFQWDQKKIAALDSKIHRELKEIFFGGMDLDPLFTGLTNSFCLRVLGIKTQLPHLFDFDFMAWIENEAPYASFVEDLSGVISP
jgi:hypothetical protein